MSVDNLASVIDQTNVKADATEDDIRRLCYEGRDYGFASIVVNPVWVRLARACVADSSVKVCSVAGFPLGATTASAKGLEARLAIEDGASEIDMVMNIGALLSGNTNSVRQDIEYVVKHARWANPASIVKVIIETALLTDDQKVMAARLVEEAGANFVKTSTGFGGLPGATVEDVRLLRGAVSPRVMIKASGGIRDRETALAMIEAGAARIGTSAGVAIVTGRPANSQPEMADQQQFGNY